MIRVLAFVLSLLFLWRGFTSRKKALWWVCLLYALSGLWLLYGLGSGADAGLIGFALPGILFSCVDNLMRRKGASQ